MLGEFVSRARRQQMPPAHHGDSVADADQFGHVAGDHEDRLAARGQFLDQPIDECLAANVDPSRGLIQQKHVHPMVKQACQRDLLLVAAGEVEDALTGAEAADVECLYPLSRRRRLLAE